MKTLFLTALMFFSINNANASILNSNLEARHQQLIEKAVYTQCGITAQLTQVSIQEKLIVVDNGIHDINYSIQLEGKVGIDQYMYDSYKINVSSEFADMYDHSSGNWGAYSVTNVNCIQMN